jgi:putative tricarboxylic transport membrane protein
MKDGARNWSEIGASLFFLLVGIAVMVGALKLNLGSPTSPQPGLFPFLGGGFVVVMSSILMAKGWLGRGENISYFEGISGPAIFVSGMAVYVGILNPLGFVIATIFLGAVILWVLNTTSWKVIAVASIGMSAGTYLLFTELLGVSLPAGVLEGIWIF